MADNTISLLDQTMFATLCATDRTAVGQCMWVYEHPIDLDGLRRFHRNLGAGLLGRRIERSPLPFGRARWVRDPQPADPAVATITRPRAELSDWADEQARVPIDPELGPGWRMAVQPLDDGATAVSLVVSHCLIDGLGFVGAVIDAVHGDGRELRYPAPRSRTRRRAIAQDAAQTVRGLPAVFRAVISAAKLRGADQHDGGSAPAQAPRTPAARHDGAESIAVPGIAIHVDNDAWETRARELGATGHHLAMAFTARLGARLGRGRPSDGAITVQFPISDRTPGDDRANALSFLSVVLDPAPMTTDLRETRAAVGRTLGALRESPTASDPMLALTPLIPFTPRRLLKKASTEAFGYADQPVACSSVGDLDPAFLAADGTEAEFLWGRGLDQRVAAGSPEHIYGLLSVLVLRVGGKVGITVGAYQPGWQNTKPALRALVTETLAEFGLSGVLDCVPGDPAAPAAGPKG